MKPIFKGILYSSLLLSASVPIASASECGTVTIADMNWNSATVIANIDKFILEHGFDCDAELVPGDTMPTGASMMSKGQPDIAPEFWSNSMKDALDQGVKDGQIQYAGTTLTNGGEEGFWVPAYMVEKDPSLATIEGVIANAKLFKHPEDPEKSAFYSCPAGWNCQISAGNLVRALGLDNSGFDVIDPGSGAGLSGSIAKAYERNEAWLGYYWAPTAVLGKYKMVKVDFGSGVDEKHFQECVTQETCLEPKATMYPPSPVETVVTSEFAARSADAMAYFSKREFTNAQMNELLAWMEDEQADGEFAAEHFMTEYKQTWANWLPADVAQKVQKAIDEL
ncbi:ABC transporter substrate-binding protein [Vibrio sp. ZSDZ34]|jgi:glycine betaine/proline transport system substrate-binding protein|uniref:ABC transporter substrate-binding protein n=1 Tax=Vibrio gelatinilyticus TaxID=2893468 RepID=A0A9X1WBY0_9VIBR|nr:ABC transporter substrate-binding protein [Vibrio gelatinilyticus]MCJ2377491.1 ABC transporter substrate-binding protein [Vibrio gelatinilyticus]